MNTSVQTSVPNIDSMSSLARSIASISKGNPEQESKDINDTWGQSKQSVVEASRKLGKSYNETLRNLTSPALAVISPDDPRVAAYDMAKSDIANLRNSPRAVGDDAARVVSERNAVEKLKTNPDDERAWGTLVAISHAEVMRDVSLTKATPLNTKDADKQVKPIKSVKKDKER